MAISIKYVEGYLTLSFCGESFRINDGQEVFYEVMEVLQCAMDEQEVYCEATQELYWCEDEEELGDLMDFYRNHGQEVFYKVMEALCEMDKRAAFFQIMNILQCDVDEEQLYEILTDAEELR